MPDDPVVPPQLTGPVALGARSAPSRVLFGPHVTNLGRGRAFSDAHVGYYAARAGGGAGIVVTEVASVHDSDHPYERAPGPDPGWGAVVAGCRPHGTLVLAGIGHAGGQGSSAYHRRGLWAPSRTPDPGSGEVPYAMGADEIAALVAGFAGTAVRAVDAGCDGVEVQAGAHALLRQFRSGLTNHRDDAYGHDRDLLLVEVLTAVRAAVGAGVLLGVRLGVDECAPWAGITPADGVASAARIAALVDLVVPVRGSGLSVAVTRPDGHTPPGFGRETCARVRAAVTGRAVAGRAVTGPAVVLSGSVVDPDQARDALAAGDADLVEMTRAQIADPDLVAHVRAARAPRPCVLTNQECRVRDVANARIACTVSPPDPEPAPGAAVDVVVVGGGPAGLEGARTLARAGHRVRLVERGDELGGLLRPIAQLPGRERFARFADWLVDEVLALGVDVRLGMEAGVPADGAVLLATGTRTRAGRGIGVLAALDACPPGPVVIDDPLGDGAAVGLAEVLAAAGRTVALVSPDPVAGTQLARTGDLVDANTRLQRLGVDRVLEARLESWDGATAVARDVDTGARRDLPCAVLVDAGPRSAPPLPVRPGLVPAGDAVAPRTVAEAVREGRRAARALVMR